MRKIALTSLLLLNLIAAYSQPNIQDSLFQVLKTQKQDTARVKNLLWLAGDLFVSKPDTSILLSIEALALSKRIDFSEGVIESLGLIGVSYTVAGNYPKALDYHLKRLKLVEKSRDTFAIASSYNLLGALYREQGNYQEAINYLYKGKALQNRFDILTNICDTYIHLNMADSARLYGQQALTMAYQSKNDRSMGWILFEMAFVHLLAEEYPLALANFRMSIPLSRNVNDYVALCKQYRGMAEVFEKTGQIDSSFQYARDALSIAQQSSMLNEVIKSSSFLSTLYRKRHNPDSALAYMDIAKAANDSLFNQQRESQVQSLTFDEKIRQIELQEREKQEMEQRKHNLQFSAIALGLISFLVLFLLLSHSVVVNQKTIRFLGVVSLLLVFEFINLLIHPFLGEMTHHSPIWMLLIMVCIAALLVPLHHKIEHWLTHKLVEKNNRIRLAAAKKTIADLEPM
ncbi:tetratricopeptide repeat protein [Rufibacter aurantiacus]|uniref:tetratricopeptide repeat protein n=1 Tax=Rufibacter aurantiacus TaxID=2817374 RepID=UPI001B30F98E|nr:tetratricopeptide repeat protein [Rufibacter aurantiacus]